jgi:ribosomal protein S18 acetylase RimI-like enzyme
MTTLAVRAVTATDAEAVATLIAGVAHGPSETADEFAEELAGAPSGSAWALEEGDELVGYGSVRRRGPLIVDGDLATLPGREAPLLELIEAYARELGAPVLRVTPRGGAGLEGHGYRLERTFLRLGAAIADTAAPSEGATAVAPVSPTDAALHRLDQTCFAASWGFVPETYTQWRVRVASRPPGPCFVARAAGEPIGGIRCSYRFGWGWVNSLVVAPAARDRGVGAQLLAAGIAALEATHVGLEVDARNDPALRLYARAGLRELDTERFYEKELRP